jgi:hypothetical protein
MREGDGASCGPVGAACLDVVAEAQSDQNMFLATAEALRLVAHAAGGQARWCESCACHEHVWTAGGSFAKRQKLLEISSGRARCPWKGRRGPELARGRRKHMAFQVRQANSDRLQRYLFVLDAEQRAIVLSMKQRVSDRLAEEVLDKFAFWEDLPYSLCGCYPPIAGPSQEQAARCLQQWEALEHSGKAQRADRLAVRVLKPGGQFRADFERFATTGQCSDALFVGRLSAAKPLGSLVVMLGVGPPHYSGRQRFAGCHWDCPWRFPRL